MGNGSSFICRACGAHFMVYGGGGFYFDQLHCDACGEVASVGHEELGNIHLRFIKGLSRPSTVSRSAMDSQIQLEYPGSQPITRDEYHALAEATMAPCACGGRFRYGAPQRCPACRSLRDQWDPRPGNRSVPR